MPNVVSVNHLRKTYGKTIAVEDIPFEVEEGEIFGMVGPNGDGKTTTIECLEGLRKPDSGEVVNALSAHGITFTDIRMEQPSLEDVFLQLTGRAMRD